MNALAIKSPISIALPDLSTKERAYAPCSVKTVGYVRLPVLMRSRITICDPSPLKSFSFNLHVTADYPIRGGSDTRTSDASISVSIDDEPNDDPVASDALSLIVGDDGLSVATLVDQDDGND